MFMSTWTSHRPRHRAPLVLSRSGGRLGPCPGSLRTLSRSWQSTQAVLLAALPRVTGGSAGVCLVWRAAAAGTVVRAADAVAIERNNLQAHRSLTTGQGPM